MLLFSYYSLSLNVSVDLIFHSNKRLCFNFFLFLSRAIVKNSDLLPSTPWSNVLFNDFWGTPLTHSGSHKSYRPLCVTSFRINYYVGGLNPFGYHVVNVLLHTTVCWLVVILSYTLVHAHFPSLVAGLLFAVHPIHTGKIDMLTPADMICSLHTFFWINNHNYFMLWMY